MEKQHRAGVSRISAFALVLVILLSSCATSSKHWITQDGQKMERRTNKDKNYHFAPLTFMATIAILIFFDNGN